MKAVWTYLSYLITTLWRERRRMVLDMTEGDTAVIDIVGRKLKRDLVARQDADAVFLHLATSVCHELMAIIERDAESGIRQYLHHHPIHFNQFFFSHLTLQ